MLAVLADVGEIQEYNAYCGRSRATNETGDSQGMCIGPERHFAREGGRTMHVQTAQNGIRTLRWTKDASGAILRLNTEIMHDSLSKSAIHFMP